MLAWTVFLMALFRGLRNRMAPAVGVPPTTHVGTIWMRERERESCGGAHYPRCKGPLYYFLATHFFSKARDFKHTQGISANRSVIPTEYYLLAFPFIPMAFTRLVQDPLETCDLKCAIFARSSSQVVLSQSPNR